MCPNRVPEGLQAIQGFAVNSTEETECPLEERLGIFRIAVIPVSLTEGGELPLLLFGKEY